MDKLKIAVIGVGRLGNIHSRIYRELANVDLIGVCDINRARVEEAAKTFDTTAFYNYKQLIGNIDAASICVPTNLHFDIANTLLRYNINVLIEKPITDNISDAQKLIRLAKKNNLLIQVGHVERFNSAFKAIKPVVKNPKFIECHRLSLFPKRSLDVGVVLDVMIHDIDIVLGLVESKIKRIESVGVKVLTDNEDIANARISFENGCIVNLTSSRVSDEVMRKIRIFLKDTYISLDYCQQEAFIYKKFDNDIKKTPIPIEKEEPLKKELESFVWCVLNKKRPLISGKEGLIALKLALIIIDQIHKKKPIKQRLSGK